LETTETNPNYLHEEVKTKNSGNACLYSVRNCCLPSNYQKIKINETEILPVVLYGCGTWSLTSKERHGLRVSGNWVLRTIFGSKGEEETGGW